MSIPMGHLVGKIGYKNGVIGGFLLTAVGCLLFYSGLTLNQYGVASPCRTGLKLIHYIIAPAHRERDKSTNLHFQIQALYRCLYCFDIIQPKNRKQVTIITGRYVT